MASILAVPGLDKLTAEELCALWNLAARNGWDVDAIATIISRESRFDPTIKNPLKSPTTGKEQSASGLLQWIDSTARHFFGLSASEIRTMSRLEQLGLVETWYAKNFGERPPRMVDYYVVQLGRPMGTSMDTVILREGTDAYAMNAAALDANQDGTVTPRDLLTAMQRTQAKVGGKRIEVPLAASESSDPPPPESEPEAELYSSLLSGSEPSLLDVLRVGAAGLDVCVVQYLTGAKPIDGIFGAITDKYVRRFQHRARCTVDGVVGKETWTALRASLYEGVR